jgi:hypothetical protein
MRLLATALLSALLAPQAWAAGDIETARAAVTTVYKRLASIPPTQAELEGWAQQYVDAADAAAERGVLLTVADAATTNDNFYQNTVLNFAEPETNESFEITNELTDHTATIVGMVRDEVDYRQVLYGDIIYIPNPNLGLSPYALTDNQAYEDLQNAYETGAQPFGSSLQQAAQSATTGFPIQAGIYTTRGYGSVFYNAGTNRAPVRYTFVNYICRDMEELSDVTRPDIYVRRDVDRTPGGDGEKFRTECVGCHAGMDPQTKAFAYLNWEENGNNDMTITYAQQPVPKVNRNNDTFPNGAVVQDDAWLNIWYEGANADLGWNPEMKSGTGPASWGESIATTDMFPSCMAERVYKTVCFKSNMNTRDKANLRSLSKQFVDDGYNMKNLFKNAAVECVDSLRL